MSLARKHPLRLLLPPGLRSPREEVHEPSDLQNLDPEVVPMPEDRLFAFNVPDNEPALSPAYSRKAYGDFSLSTIGTYLTYPRRLLDKWPLLILISDHSLALQSNQQPYSPPSLLKLPRLLLFTLAHILT